MQASAQLPSFCYKQYQERSANSLAPLQRVCLAAGDLLRKTIINE